MEIIYKRYLFEARHVPNLLYSELRNRAFNNYVKDYSALNHKNNVIELRNLLTYKKIFAEIHRYGYLNENIPDLDRTVQESINFALQANNELKIRNYIRLGSRFYFLINTEQKFEDLVSYIKETYYKDGALENIGKIYDIGNFAIRIKEDSIDLNISFGPMRNLEIPQFVEFEYHNDPEAFFFFDVDCSHTKPTDPKISEFINRSRKLAVKYLNNFEKGLE